jgi:hypothetical protein
MTPKNREDFLQAIRAGNGTEIAASMAGVSLDEVKADESLMDEAMRIMCLFNARLRERLLGKALESDDVKLLSSLLEQREAEISKQTKKHDPRQMARAILSTLEDLGKELGFRVAIAEPGERLIRVPDSVLSDHIFNEQKGPENG